MKKREIKCKNCQDSYGACVQCLKLSFYFSIVEKVRKQQISFPIIELPKQKQKEFEKKLKEMHKFYFSGKA